MKLVFILFFSVNLANASEPLTIAVEDRDVDRVKKLIANGYKVNERDHSLNGSTVLVLAIQNNHLEMVKILLEAGMYPDDWASSPDGSTSSGTPLLHAAREVLDAVREKRYEDSGNEELIIEELLKQGAEVSLTLLREVSSLGLSKTLENLLKYVDEKDKERFVDMTLISASTYKIVNNLLGKHGANPNAVTEYGVTTLIDAVQNGYYKIAMELIAKGASVNEADKSGTTVLMHVLNNMHRYKVAHLEMIIDKLIAKGASVNEADKSGTTVLMHVLNNMHRYKVAHLEMVIDKLMTAGASVKDGNILAYFIKNIANYYSRDDEQNIRILKILLKNGAKIDEKDKDVNTNLLLYVTKNKYFELVDQLIKARADVNVSSFYDFTNFDNRTPFDDGMTPLVHASRHGDLGAVKKLIEAGAEVGPLGGFSPSKALTEAVQAGHLEVVRTLIKTDAKYTNDYDNLALLKFSSYGNIDAIEKLIEDGAKVNSQIIGFITPLRAAARYGHLGAVKKLIEAGAEVNLDHGSLFFEKRTALHEAIASQRLDIVEVLLEAGAMVEDVEELLYRTKINTRWDKKFNMALQQLFRNNHLKRTKNVGSQQAGKALEKKGICEGLFSNK